MWWAEFSKYIVLSLWVCTHVAFSEGRFFELPTEKATFEYFKDTGTLSLDEFIEQWNEKENNKNIPNSFYNIHILSYAVNSNRADITKYLIDNLDKSFRYYLKMQKPLEPDFWASPIEYAFDQYHLNFDNDSKEAWINVIEILSNKLRQKNESKKLLVSVLVKNLINFETGGFILFSKNLFEELIVDISETSDSKSVGNSNFMYDFFSSINVENFKNNKNFLNNYYKVVDYVFDFSIENNFKDINISINGESVLDIAFKNNNNVTTLIKLLELGCCSHYGKREVHKALMKDNAVDNFYFEKKSQKYKSQKLNDLKEAANECRFPKIIKTT